MTPRDDDPLVVDGLQLRSAVWRVDADWGGPVVAVGDKMFANLPPLAVRPMVQGGVDATEDFEQFLMMGGEAAPAHKIEHRPLRAYLSPRRLVAGSFSATYV